MKEKLSRYGFSLMRLCIAVALMLPAWHWSAARTPAEELATLTASKAIDPQATAVCITDLATGECLTAFNPALPLTPASIMKCVTTASLRAALPFGHTINTAVYLRGKKDGDSFTGSLIVTGAGDPSLGASRHADHPSFTANIVEALKRRKINSFKGEIKIDGSLFKGPATPPSWLPADLSQSYGAGLFAFNFEGNSSGKKAVDNPASLFRTRLVSAMREGGISFGEADGGSGGNPELLLDFPSPLLGELMQSCMFRSDNLYAEAFLRLFSLENGGDGSGAMAARLAMQHWEALNFPVEGVSIVDGSGLSRDNLLSAVFMTAVLQSRKDDAEYVSLFPKVGEEGTVRSFMQNTPLQGRMVLKTGSMSGIQSYAGYLLGDDGRPTHCIVVMANNLKNRSQFKVDLTRFFTGVFE